MNATEARALTDEFLESVRATPGGEKIDQCLQCGTCSASCPSSRAMDYPPRAAIAALRAGMLDRVLASNTVWLCTSCYLCTVRCPAGIPFTDVMYQLKRLGIEKGYVRGRTNGVEMAKAFVEVVDRCGRSSEGELLRNYFWSTNPLRALAYLPLGWRLLRRGRIGVRPRRIAGIEGLRTMMAAMEKGRSR
jgi:heterodisulfide reductase subunit C